MNTMLSNIQTMNVIFGLITMILNGKHISSDRNCLDKQHITTLIINDWFPCVVLLVLILFELIGIDEDFISIAFPLLILSLLIALVDNGAGIVGIELLLSSIPF